jgi:tetratricopeptide (TPR) repeat protein
MKRAVWAVSLVVLCTAGAGWFYWLGDTERAYRQLVSSGDEALRADQAFQAIEAYSNAIYLRPDSMLAHLRRGEAYQRRGDLDAAARDFELAAEIDRAATRPLEALGDMRVSQGRFTAASRSYERLLALDDRAVTVLRKLALARYRGGNLSSAVDALRRASAIAPGVADDFYLLGLCLREKGQLTDAIAAQERAIRLSPVAGRS